MKKNLLSKTERESLGLHLSLSLSIIACLGVALIAIGFSYNKFYITLLGIFLTFIPIIIFLIVSSLKYKKYIYEIKKPHLDFINEIDKRLRLAYEIVELLKREFPSQSNEESSIDRTKWSKAGFIHFLSLERLIQALEERLNSVEIDLNSYNEDRIFKAIENLEVPLTFENRSDKHLLDHNMPEMPKSSWLDSLDFLRSKVIEEKEKIKKSSKSPIDSLQ